MAKVAALNVGSERSISSQKQRVFVKALDGSDDYKATQGTHETWR